MAPKTIYTVQYRNIIQRVRLLRIERGFTQAEIALSLGWSQQALSAVEAGARRLDVIEYFRICKELGLKPEAALELLREAGCFASEEQKE